MAKLLLILPRDKILLDAENIENRYYLKNYGTGRLQTVTKDRNGKFYDLVRAFFEQTGIPILLNTSFNVMGEPIVETPEDALWCLLYTGVDYCVLEDCVVTKTEKYNSILDFYPYRKLINYHLLSNINIENKFTFGYEFAGGEDEKGELLFSTSNKWGILQVVGEKKWLSLLKLIDGKKTG